MHLLFVMTIVAVSITSYICSPSPENPKELYIAVCELVFFAVGVAGLGCCAVVYNERAENGLSQLRLELDGCNRKIDRQARESNKRDLEVTSLACELNDCRASLGAFKLGYTQKHKRHNVGLEECCKQLDSTRNLVDLLYECAIHPGSGQLSRLTSNAVASNDKAFIEKSFNGFFGEKVLPWPFHVCEIAAAKGHLEMLKCLRANGCPWDYQTLYGAVRSRCKEVVEWVLKNLTTEERTEWSTQFNVYAAKIADNLHMLQVLYEPPQGLEVCPLGMISEHCWQISDENFQYLLSKTGTTTLTEQQFIQLMHGTSEDSFVKYLPHFSGRVAGGLTTRMLGQFWPTSKKVAWLLDPTKPGGACPS